MKAAFWLLIVAVSMLLATYQVESAEKVPNELQGVGIVEKLGQQIDLKLEFKDETGQIVSLSKYFDGKKPVLLLLAYYGCPNLCNFFLNGVTDTLKTLRWLPGKEFEVVTVSIDPRETSDLALKKKASHIKELGKPEAEKGWHFLVNKESTQDPNFTSSASILSSQVGFNYRYDKEQNQYAHSAAAIFLTPSGKVSRYLFGIQFTDKDFRLALSEASGNKIGNLVDQIILFCYNYDPKTRRYSLYAINLVRVGAVITVLTLAASIFLMRKRQRKNLEVTT